MNKMNFDLNELISNQIKEFTKKYSSVREINVRNLNKRKVSLTQRTSREDSEDTRYILTDKRFHNDGYVRLDVIAFEDKEGNIVKELCGPTINIVPEKAKLFHIDFCGYSGPDTAYRWGGSFSSASIKNIKTGENMGLNLEETAKLLYDLNVL